MTKTNLHHRQPKPARPMRTLTALLGLVCLLGGTATQAVAANANALSAEQARAFASCLPQFYEAGERAENNRALKAINNELDGSRIIDGKLKMFSMPMARLKQMKPDIYADFDGMAKSCGMNSVKNFADIGDKVMAAYMARNMPPEATAQLAQLTPEMMAMMPPAARQGFAMMEVLENVPEADKNALDEETIKAIDIATRNSAKRGKIPSIVGRN